MTSTTSVKEGDILVFCYESHSWPLKGTSHYRGMTVGREYTVLKVVEGCNISGHGSARPYRVFEIVDDLGDTERREDEYFMTPKQYQAYCTKPLLARTEGSKWELPKSQEAYDKMAAQVGRVFCDKDEEDWGVYEHNLIKQTLAAIGIKRPKY